MAASADESEPEVDVEELESAYDNERQLDLPEDELDVREDKFSVFEMARKGRNANLVLSPDWQRQDVWSPDRQSRFIESVLMNIPLPPFYLNERQDGTLVVVDGKQRLTAVLRFLDGQYRLSSLKRTKLNGLSFNALDQRLRTRIEDRRLNYYVLKPSVPPSLVHDIFDRINSGGMPLNRQEIRNGIYQGKSTQLLNELAESDAFLAATGGGISKRRMRDRELVLRCLAVVLADIDTDYRSMDDFLATTMKRLNTASDAHIRSVHEEAHKTFERCARAFGDLCFRFATEGRRTPVNASIAEAVFAAMWGSEAFPQPGSGQEAYAQIVRSEKFIDAARAATGDKLRLRTRLGLAREALRGPL